jgi:ribA/ribD-fused uncharacterized protein
MEVITSMCCYTEAMRKTDRHTFFFSKNDAFSNWYPMAFRFRDLDFSCGEQFMMYAKARQFGDLEVASKILLSHDPMEQKRLGRQVKGFDKAIWDGRCRHTVYVGSRERFTQNEFAYDLLLSTQGTELVEAAPRDNIWGVGLSENDPRIDDPRNWKGTNWLGQVLTKLRDDLLLQPRPAFNANLAPSSLPRPSR